VQRSAIQYRTVIVPMLHPLRLYHLRSPSYHLSIIIIHRQRPMMVITHNTVTHNAHDELGPLYSTHHPPGTCPARHGQIGEQTHLDCTLRPCSTILHSLPSRPNEARHLWKFYVQVTSYRLQVTGLGLVVCQRLPLHSTYSSLP
jgi:hypothetical protein